MCLRASTAQTMCATVQSRSSTAGDQVRSVLIEPKASAPRTSPPATSGIVAFDLGPNRWMRALSTAASSGRSSSREKTIFSPLITCM